VFINGKQIDEIPMINFPKIACNEPMDPYNNKNKKKTLDPRIPILENLVKLTMNNSGNPMYFRRPIISILNIIHLNLNNLLP
jgi:hypothetical protein